MPISAKVHIWPKEIAAEVNERGNVLISGLDKETGTIISIEVHSAQWKNVLAKMGRLSGVGIVKPEGLELVMDPPEDKDGHTN